MKKSKLIADKPAAIFYLITVIFIIFLLIYLYHFVSVHDTYIGKFYIGVYYNYSYIFSDNFAKYKNIANYSKTNISMTGTPLLLLIDSFRFCEQPYGYIYNKQGLLLLKKYHKELSKYMKNEITYLLANNYPYYMAAKDGSCFALYITTDGIYALVINRAFIVPATLVIYKIKKLPNTIDNLPLFMF